MSKFSPERMSQNKVYMEEWLYQEIKFFESITMPPEEADRVRKQHPDWVKEGKREG